MNAPRQLLHALQRALRVYLSFAQGRFGHRRVSAQLVPRQAQPGQHADQLLLDAVVQVALQDEPVKGPADFGYRWAGPLISIAILADFIPHGHNEVVDAVINVLTVVGPAAIGYRLLTMPDAAWESGDDVQPPADARLHRGQNQVPSPADARG